MTDTTAQQNMERSHQAHCIPDRKISLDHMRGYRFAEVALFTGTSAENAIADFYNSTGVDHPAPSRFATLDKDTITQEHQALGVFLNPPRYWMFDEFRVFEAGEDQEFGGIKMTWMGVVDVATLQKAIIGGNYFPGYIHRDNSYTYNQGSEVYLLDAPGGESSSCNPTTPTPTTAWPRSRALPPSAAGSHCQKAGGSGSRPSIVTWWSPRTRPASWRMSCKTSCSTAIRAPTAQGPQLRPLDQD